jgi:hypothetical protein
MPFISEKEIPNNPGYSNFGGLVKEVLEFGFNDGPQVNKKRIEAWINEGQFQIARQVNAPEFQETAQISLVAGQYKYSLPANFLRMQDIYYPELLQRLRMVDLQQFDTMGHSEASNEQVRAQPEYYTLYKNELWLYPVPPAITNGETLEIRYIQNPEYMNEAEDVPILNANYWHLLIKYAIVRAFEAEDDFELAQQHLTRYKADLDAYASDVQERVRDRPRIVDGTWGGLGTSGMRGVI